MRQGRVQEQGRIGNFKRCIGDDGGGSRTVRRGVDSRRRHRIAIVVVVAVVVVMVVLPVFVGYSSGMTVHDDGHVLLFYRYYSREFDSMAV